MPLRGNESSLLSLSWWAVESRSQEKISKLETQLTEILEYSG